jgi:Plasmid encoded RepA protein
MKINKKSRNSRSQKLSLIQERALRTASEITLDPPEQIAYQHTVLCQTCLPYRDPGETIRKWAREQGQVSLFLIAGEAKNPQTNQWVELGLPFGPKARLILSHLNSEALKNGSPVIEVEDSLTAFVRRIQDPLRRGRSVTGPEIRKFKDQLSRLAAATIRFAVNLDNRSIQVNSQIVTAFDLWFPKDNRQRVLWPTTIQLSQDYFNSLAKHAVPLDERALSALAHSAMALDLYCWLAQRLHRIPQGKPQLVPWGSLHKQFGQGYNRVRNFRRDFLTTLRLVQTQYSAAHFDLGEKGLYLSHSLPPVPPKLMLIGRNFSETSEPAARN